MKTKYWVILGGVVASMLVIAVTNSFIWAGVVLVCYLGIMLQLEHLKHEIIKVLKEE